MKRKIYYVLTLAEKFISTKELGWQLDFFIPSSDSNVVHFSNLEIEFEQTGDKFKMEEASEALYKFINKYYPQMDYRVYYWTLERIDNDK